MSEGMHPSVAEDFFVEVDHFEIANGHDGPFRGAPEVAVAIGVYALGAQRRTLLRSVFRAPPLEGSYPAIVAARDDARAAAICTNAASILVVAIGVEEDSGAGLARIFGALERADVLGLATTEHGHDVLELRDAPHAWGSAWGEARRAVVVVDGTPLQQLCVGDDWVGAAAVCVQRRPRVRRHRLHLVSDDHANDWTLVASTSTR